MHTLLDPELGVWYLLDKSCGRRVHLKLFVHAPFYENSDVNYVLRFHRTGTAFKVWWNLEKATMVDSVET